MPHSHALNALEELFVRDLQRLKTEILAYKNEEDLWLLPDGISNTAGNLALHLVGNLKHFVAHTLGGMDYQRQREQEFSARGIAREKILAEIDECQDWVSQTLEKMPEAKLQENFPIRIFDREHINLHFLMHLAGHLNYHLGQINYHRRILSK